MAYSFPEYQDALTFGRTTHDTVLDSDGQLKTILNRLNETTDLTDTSSNNWFHIRATVTESGVGSKGKTRYNLAEDTNANSHYIRNYYNLTAGHYYAFAADVEANGRSVINYAVLDGAVEWKFDLSTMTATQVSGGTNDAGFISLISGNEYKVILYVQATTTASVYNDILLSNGTTTSYTGDGSSGVYLSRVRVMKAAVHAPVERVTNGTFDTDTSGWTVNSDATATSVSGEMVVTATAVTNRVVNQAISVVAGETYRFVVDVRSDNTNSRIRVSNSSSSASPAADYVDITPTAVMTSYIFTITPTSSTIYVAVLPDTDGVSETIVDNISVTKVITDGMQLGSDGEDFVDGAGPIYVDGRAYDGNGASLGKQCFEGRTNLVTYSNDLSNGIYTASNVSVSRDQIGIDGDLTAFTVNDASGSTSGYIETITTVSNDSTSHISEYRVKKTTSDTHYLTAMLAFTGGTTVDRRITVNTNDGTVSSTSSPAPDDYGVVDEGSYWLVYVVAANNSSGNTSKYSRVYPAMDSAGTTTTTGSKVLYSVATSAGSSPVPYIPTNGSAVARGADSTYKLLNEFGFRQDQYSVLAEFQSAGSDGVDYPIVWSLAGSCSVQLNTGNSLYANVTNGPSFANMGTYTADTTVKVAGAVASGDVGFSDDGDAVVSGTNTGTGTTSTIYLGNHVGDNSLNGYLKRLVIWPTRLADATLVEQSS